MLDEVQLCVRLRNIKSITAKGVGSAVKADKEELRRMVPGESVFHDWNKAHRWFIKAVLS